MARCSCGNATCSCVIKPDPGSGVTVTGSGSPTRPYLIGLESDGDITNQIGVSDTATLNLEMGALDANGKATIYGYATQKMTDLADVADLEGPQEGDVPIWTNGHWEFKPQGTVNPGAISVSNGIGGDGSAPNPLKALTSGIWGAAGPGGNGFPGLDKYGSDSSLGQPVYVDSTGQLRAAPQVLTGDSRTAASLSGTYPVGISIMSASTGVGSWPTGGTVVTMRRSAAGDGYIAQWFYPGALTLGLQYRQGSPTAWSPWIIQAEDTGWQPIAIQSGFTSQGAEIPQVRRLNGVVYSRGGWSGTGLTVSSTVTGIGIVPAGFRPTQNVIHRAGSASGAATGELFIGSSGNVDARIGPVSTYLMLGATWLTD